MLHALDSSQSPLQGDFSFFFFLKTTTKTEASFKGSAIGFKGGRFSVYFQTKAFRSGFPNVVGICIFVLLVSLLVSFSFFFDFDFAKMYGGCWDIAGRMLMRQSFSAVLGIMG